jgi:hypothetical protein
MQHTSNKRGDTMKLETVASHNLYREASEQTMRESKKARVKARKEDRRAKFFDGMQFQAFQAARATR